MTQLSAQELQDTANVLLALGPDALAILQYLYTVERPVTQIEIVAGIKNLFDPPIDLRQVESNIQELQRLHIVEARYDRASMGQMERNLVQLDMRMPFFMVRLLGILWPKPAHPDLRERVHELERIITDLESEIENLRGHIQQQYHPEGP